jgi:pyridoxine 4-dehydrogenase
MNPQAPGGTIALAGKNASRLVLGTMRLTGPELWGAAPDPNLARRVLRDAVHEHGITHIDTADAYGPHTVEELVRGALAPYPAEVLIASKIGMVRPSPPQWRPLGRPEYLRAACELTLRRLGTERLDLCYLHRVDPDVPLADQVGTLAELRDQGKIGAIGLSKITAEQLAEARRHAPIAAVQNQLNANEPEDPLVADCAAAGIAYLAFRPLDVGRLAPAAALGFLFGLGPHVAAVAGTGDLGHLRQLVDAARTGARA